MYIVSTFLQFDSLKRFMKQRQILYPIIDLVLMITWDYFSVTCLCHHNQLQYKRFSSCLLVCKHCASTMVSVRKFPHVRKGKHIGAMVSTVTLHQEGLWVQFPGQGLSLRSWPILSVSAMVLSGYSGFFPQSKKHAVWGLV